MIDRSESHLIAQERRNRGGSTNESTTKTGGRVGDRITRRKPDPARAPRVEQTLKQSKHPAPRTRLR
jgi:hypothetical protein